MAAFKGSNQSGESGKENSDAKEGSAMKPPPFEKLVLKTMLRRNQMLARLKGSLSDFRFGEVNDEGALKMICGVTLDVFVTISLSKEGWVLSVSGKSAKETKEIIQSIKQLLED